LYVATNGNDSNDGSFDAPFLTLQRARDAAMNMKPNGGLTIYLRGGEYELNNTFTLNSYNSGTSVSPVTYSAYNNETVRLTGAKSLKYADFVPASQASKSRLAEQAAAGSLLEIDMAAQGLTDYGTIDRRGYQISKGIMPQMELAIDGERMTLARWPNTGFTGYNAVVRAGERTPEKITQGCEYQYSGDRPALWGHSEEIFVSGVLGANYSYDYYPVQSIDTAQKTVILKEGAIVPYYSKHFFYYENVFEEIDSPGEYFIDRTSGKLYLYPPFGWNENSKISVSYLQQPMIDINNAAYITLMGLNMDGGRTDAIRLTQTAEQITIKNCDIRNFAGKGITVTNGQRCLISNNKIYNIGNTAVAVNGGDYEKLIPSYNTIEKNDISKCSYIDRAYTTAITLGYHSVGINVRNNKIYNTPHTAMIIYGVDHKIEYNDISDAVREFHDMDAIYMNVSVYPWERGVVFSRNYIHDLGQQIFNGEKQMNVSGIRSDNGGHGITVKQNIFADIGRQNANAVRGVCALGTRNVVTGNIFVDTSGTFYANTNYNASAAYDMTDSKTLDLKSKMDARLPVYGKKYPELYNFFNEHPNSAYQTNVFENNLIVNIKYPLSSVNGNLQSEGFTGAAQLVKSGGNYNTNIDPGFLDYAGENYKLNSNSVVFTAIPGFVNIPFELIGIK